ncbi:MAG: hypothetical protein HYY85_08260 [Deltaproteobacteria bacterium]|nr:hypothetical protein [Deltaproteobacteria bacterium]
MIELTLTFRPAALPLARQELQCLPADGPRAALDLGLPLALQELVRNYLEEVPAAELPDGQRQAVEEAVARMRQDIWVTYRKPGREGGYLTLRTESIRPRDEDTVSFAPVLRVRGSRPPGRTGTAAAGLAGTLLRRRPGEWSGTIPREFS